MSTPSSTANTATPWATTIGFLNLDRSEHELKDSTSFMTVTELNQEISARFPKGFAPCSFSSESSNGRDIMWDKHSQIQLENLPRAALQKLFLRLTEDRNRSEIREWSQDFPEDTRKKMIDFADRVLPGELKQMEEYDEISECVERLDVWKDVPCDEEEEDSNVPEKQRLEGKSEEGRSECVSSKEKQKGIDEEVDNMMKLVERALSKLQGSSSKWQPLHA